MSIIKNNKGNRLTVSRQSKNDRKAYPAGAVIFFCLFC